MNKKLIKERKKLLKSKKNIRQIMDFCTGLWSYQRLYKPFSSPKGYPSFKLILAVLALEVHQYQSSKYYNYNKNDLAKAAFLGFATKCIVENYQVYWLKPELVTALLNTDIPENFENFECPIKNAIFMLPDSENPKLISPDGDKLQWLGVEFLEKNEDRPSIFKAEMPVPGNPIDVICGDIVETNYLNCITNLLNTAILYSSRIKIDEYGEVKKGDFKNTSILYENNSAEEEERFRELLYQLALKIILYMNTNQEEQLVKPTEQKPKGFGKKPTSGKLNPIYLGENYQIKYMRSHTSVASTDSKRKSPRQHWRRGHFRHLKNGHKTIWIRPMLISGEEN